MQTECSAFGGIRFKKLIDFGDCVHAQSSHRRETRVPCAMDISGRHLKSSQTANLNRQPVFVNVALHIFKSVHRLWLTGIVSEACTLRFCCLTFLSD